MYSKPTLVQYGRIAEVVTWKLFRRRDWLGLRRNWLPF